MLAAIQESVSSDTATVPAMTGAEQGGAMGTDSLADCEGGELPNVFNSVHAHL